MGPRSSGLMTFGGATASTVLALALVLVASIGQHSLTVDADKRGTVLHSSNATEVGILENFE